MRPRIGYHGFGALFVILAGLGAYTSRDSPGLSLGLFVGAAVSAWISNLFHGSVSGGEQPPRPSERREGLFQMRVVSGAMLAAVVATISFLRVWDSPYWYPIVGLAALFFIWTLRMKAE
jgi:fructose-specific phosphotransferase system IIC component